MSLIAQIPDLVARTELAWIDRELRDREDPNSMRNSGIFETIPFSDQTGNSREYSSVDIERYASETGYGESAQLMKFQQGYSKTLTMVRFALDVAFFWQDLHQSKDTTTNTKIKNMADVIPNRIELMLAHHFSFSASTSYTNREGKTVDVSMGDTYAMGYSAHTLTGSTSTYRTIVAGNPQLSRGCIEALEGLFRTDSYNELGQNNSSSMQPDTLLMTRDPNTMNTARILNMSGADPIQANSGVINPLQGKYRLIFNDNIGTDANGNIDSTKSKYVFLIDSKSAQMSCKFAVQDPAHMMPPSTAENDANRSDKIVFGVRGSMSSCIIDSKAIRMTKGDGTA